MAETFGAALVELRDVVADQVSLWRRLLETTREGTRALGAHDAPAFEQALTDQVETLRALKALEAERGRIVRTVGEGAADPETRELKAELTRLADEVRHAGRITRFALERSGAALESRIGLHRQAGTLPASGPGVDRVA